MMHPNRGSDLPNSDLPDRINRGTPSAAEEVDLRYRRQLCAMVERWMNDRHRRREDPEDVIQSAFRTFFRRVGEGKLLIDDSGALWSLLKKITRRKYLKHLEKINTQSRDPGNEEYFDGDPLQDGAPSPEEAAAFAETIENARARLSPLDSDVFQLRLLGHTMEEIAEQLGCKRGKVRYAIQRIREQLDTILAEEFEKLRL